MDALGPPTQASIAEHLELLLPALAGGRGDLQEAAAWAAELLMSAGAPSYSNAVVRTLQRLVQAGSGDVTSGETLWRWVQEFDARHDYLG